MTQNVEYIDSSKVRNPSLAWKLGMVPGLGQIYNRKYFKAVVLIASEYYTMRQFNELKNKENRIGLRNTYAWWVFGLYVLNILDSYVDAHLSTFPINRLEFSPEVDSLIIIK
tara:strand:- start:115 stop:450 length:336 start_codon:yes stop_codon:yes gene_type:complete